ncbi:hypothetical protein CHH62_17065 [Niallia circulans]|jgi:hypothetical protein|uniref:acetylglutamate semialdehyde dehydrogenase n=1 Tax=Niallia TaxID=2837506 RepID=UPI000BA5DC98|nr:acetylglutamate semialdehyde dehydrogenase [Niallia circulans]PAD24509.1 hypothetical protein CHH62_17065 [Niallia circulans]
MMSPMGPNLKELFLALLDSEQQTALGFLAFSKDEREKYIELLDELKKTNGSDASTTVKGKSLENIVKYVIDKSTVFETYLNVHTSSNEVDILARLNSKGYFFKQNGLLELPDSFISECKNHHSKVGVTYVGKFYSLMTYTDNDIGILFSYHGLTGMGWNDGIGLTKKFFLSDKNTKIIEFKLEDFEQLAKPGNSFIEIINNKIFNLKNDTSIHDFVKVHPAQDFI